MSSDLWLAFLAWWSWMFNDPWTRMMFDSGYAASPPTFSLSEKANFEGYEFVGFFIFIFWVELLPTRFTSAMNKSIGHYDGSVGTSLKI